MHVKYKQDNLHHMKWYVWDNDHVLTIHISFMVKCVCYVEFGSNGCFIAGAALMGGDYRMDIISGVIHPRSNSVVSLVSCMVEYNIRGTSIVLQVPRDSTNLARKR